MFVWSVKGNTLKFVGIICLAAILMVSLIVLVPKNSAEAEAQTAAAEIRFDKIKSNTDRVKFLEQFGWEVEKSPSNETVVKIPENFDSVTSAYNDIQKKQGLDLEKYSGKEAVRYTYKVKNFPGYDGAVTANIIVYKKTVIAGDICSSDVDGFIRELAFPEYAKDETNGEKPENENGAAESAPEETTPETAPENAGN